MPEALKITLVSVFLAAILTSSHALLKSAADNPVMSQPWLIKMFISIALYGIVFFLYAFALKFFELSVIYPIYTALSILGVFFVGAFYFQEALSIKKAIGLILLIFSIFLIA